MIWIKRLILYQIKSFDLEFLIMILYGDRPCEYFLGYS